MDPKDVLMLAFLMPTILVISWVRKKLHWVEPSTRMWIGLSSLSGSILLFLGTLKFFPRPTETDGEIVHQAVLIAVMTIIAGGVILSTLLLGSGAMQLLKRRHYYRRNGS